MDFVKGSNANGTKKRARGYSSNLTYGGLSNPSTGLGGASDHTQGALFTPTRFYWRQPLQTLYVQSWTAKKFIDIPVNDMFIRWRNFIDGDVEGVADTMREAENRHDVKGRLRQAMRAARAYGSSLIVLMTKEAPINEPLVIERLRPGDLAAIRVFDRFDASVWSRDEDLYSPTYRSALSYTLHPTWGSLPTDVHASRVLRFDGIAPLTDAPFYSYEEDWGVSEFVPVVDLLLQDASFSAAVAHMSQEASIPVLGVSSLRELIASKPRRGEATVDDIGRGINMVKSVYGMMMLDKEEEEFSRVAIQFGGLADLMSKFPSRIAAAGDIPETRFMGRSPAGMSATGDSDMRNYIMMVEAKRENQLAHVLEKLDAVLAMDSGPGRTA